MSSSVRGAVSSVLKRRVVKNPEDRRREILDATLELFGAKGFHETSMEEIAGSAGVAKGTIYLYFESKEHLLLALKKRFMSGLVDRLTDVIAEAIERVAAGAPVDYRDVVDAIFEELVAYHCEHRDALEVVVRQSPGPDLISEALELEKDFIQLIASAFREAGGFGLIQAEDPEMMARLVNAAIRDNLCTCLCYGEPEDLDRLVTAAKDLLYKALSPDFEPPPRRPRLVKSQAD